MMNRRGSAFMYVEPNTRYHVGAVFPDRETAAQWARRVAAERGDAKWDLSIRTNGRWQRIAPKRLAIRRRRSGAISV
jgi:hypothetical protein